MYIPHENWVICERTGIKFRRSELREEPNKDNPNSGRFVHKSVWNPVHPQEYVQGTEDDTSVPLVYGDVAQSQGETTLLNDMVVDDKTVFIVTRSGLAEGDPIQVTMDNGATFVNFIAELEVLSQSPLEDSEGNVIRDANGDVVYASDPNSGYLIELNDPIHYAATYDNAVYLPSINNEEWQ